MQEWVHQLAAFVKLEQVIVVLSQNKGKPNGLEPRRLDFKRLREEAVERHCIVRYSDTHVRFIEDAAAVDNERRVMKCYQLQPMQPR